MGERMDRVVRSGLIVRVSVAAMALVLAVGTPPHVAAITDAATASEVAVSPLGDAHPATEISQVGALEVIRYAGAERTETAAAIAGDRTLGGAEFDDHTVLLARSDVFADSLTGGYLAGAHDAPILLTPSDELSAATREELDAIDPDNVIVLGGEAAVSQDVAEELAEDHHVQRVAGANRIETAAEIAAYAVPDQPQDVALLATAAEFADALSASVVAAGENVPLLLTADDHLPAETEEALTDLDVDEVVIAGGPAAVDESVADDLAELGIDVDRRAGSNRFETAREVAEFAEERFGWDAAQMNLASGEGFADAVALAAHAGMGSGGPAPIALTAADDLTAPTTEWLADRAACDTGRLHVAGGTAAISEEVVDAAVDALTPAGGCDEDGEPTVQIDAPDDGETVRMSERGITVDGTAQEEETGIRTVELYVDDQRVGATVGGRGGGPVEWSIDVFPPDEDTYEVRAVATSNAGETAETTQEFEVAHFEDHETVVQEGVVVVDDDLADALSEVDDDEVVFDAPPDELGIRPGDRLVAGTTEVEPRGFLRTAVSVVRDGPRTRVLTNEAALNEVFMQVDALMRQPLDVSDAEATGDIDLETHEGPEPSEVFGPQDVEEGTRDEVFDNQPTPPASTAGNMWAAGVSPQIDVDEGIGRTWSFPWSEEFSVGPATLGMDGAVEFGVSLDFRLHIETNFSWTSIDVVFEELKLTVSGHEAFHSEIFVDGAWEDEVEHHLGSVNLPNVEFAIGPVPVVITNSIDFELYAEASFEADGQTAVSQHFSLTLGIRYTDSAGWETISEMDDGFDIEPVTFDASADAEAGIRARLASEIYDLAGPFFSIGPYAGLEVAGVPDLTWELFLGVRAEAGLQASLPGLDSLDAGFELFDERMSVASGDTEPDPEPVIVAIDSPRETTIGCCQVLLEAAVSHPRDDNVQDVEWVTDTGVTLGEAPEYAPIRTELGTGTHEITAVVTEELDGETQEWESDPVEVEIVEAGEGEAPQLEVEPVSLSDFTAGVTLMATAESLSPFGPVSLLAEPDVGAADTPLGLVSDVPRFTDSDQEAAVLSTGRAADVDERRLGPFGEGTELDEDHHGALGDSDYDATIVSIDVNAPEWAQCLEFDYRFVSQETPHFVGTEFNDAFLAQVTDRDDEPGWEVDGSEISGESFTIAPDDPFYADADMPLAVNNLASLWVTDVAAYQTPFDAGTPAMRAATPISEGEHTLHLGLFDQGDALYDSAVFLKGFNVTATSGSCESGLGPRGLDLTPHDPDA